MALLVQAIACDSGAPGEGTTLRCYLRKPPGVERPPVVIHHGGIDSFKEERHRYAGPVLANGWASLAMDMRTQLLSGYLPMFFHADPKSVLVVGQGSGVSLRSFALTRGIAYSRALYWRRRRADELATIAQRVELLEVRITPGTRPVADGQFSLRKP